MGKCLFRFTKITTLLIATFIMATSAHSQVIHPYFQIGEVKSEIINMGTEPVSNEMLSIARESYLEHSKYKKELIDGITVIDPMAIADLLLKVWDIIVANKPVVNIEYKNATALPNLAKDDWRALTGWKPERVVLYKLSIKNIYGTTVVDFKYQLKLLAGGGVKGKGLYVASARVLPDAKVLWGYNLDVSVNVPAVVNTGTEEDPHAAIYIDVTSRVSNTFKNQTQSQSYLLQGDGLIKNQTTGEVYFEPFVTIPQTTVTVTATSTDTNTNSATGTFTSTQTQTGTATSAHPWF